MPLCGWLLQAWPQSQDLAVFQYSDSDHALEWAEDRLIATLAPPTDPTQETALADNDLCVTLSGEERAGLAAIAQRLEFAAGTPVFRTGEAANALFLVAQGRFEVLLPAPGQPPRRLSTLSPGMYFGELPLASGNPARPMWWRATAGPAGASPLRRSSAGLKIRLLSTIASRLAESLAEQARVRRLVSGPGDATDQKSGRFQYPNIQEKAMSDRVYKLVEVVGTSSNGTDDAIRNAITTAGKTIRHIDWFEVVKTTGHVLDSKIAHFQVTLKIGFRLESD